MKLDFAGWLYGLGSGFIGGGAGAIGVGVAQGLTDPGHTDLRHMFALMGTTFIVSGTLFAFAYLAKSPLPPIEPQVTVVQTTTQPSSAPQTTTTVVKTGTETKP